MTLHGVAADGNRIYSVAGNSQGQYFNNVDVATIDAAGTLSAWQSLTPLPTALLDPMVAVINGYLYVFGGESTDPFNLTPGRQVRRAPIRSDGFIGDWQIIDDALLNPRPHSNYIRNNGTLHLLGGGVHSYMTSTVESVLEGDLGQPGRAVLSTPLPTILNQMGTAVVGNYAYAIGGVTAPFGATWTEKVWFTRLPDITPPVIRPTVSGLQGQNGWYRDTVSVTWSVADPDSGILSSSGCTPNTITNETAGLTLTCSATNNEGLTASSSVTIKLDRTPPSISSSRAPLPNFAGWNNSNVTVRFSCTDALSGMAYVAPISTLLSAEGANQSASASCTDLAGNSSETTVGGINIDLTPPNISGIRAPLPNAMGWNNTRVTVSFSCTDPLSGIPSVAPIIAAVLPNEGANQTATGECTDNAGNRSSTNIGGINIDLTPPLIIGARAPVANAAGWNNTDVTATFSCTDALSGTPTSAPFSIVLSSEGANQSAPGTCTDNAGNTASAAISGINIDKTPPALTALNVAPNPQVVGSSVSLTARLTDTLSGFGSWRYSISGASPVSFNASGTDSAVAAQFTQSNAGVYPVCARAIDAAGNSSAEDCLYAVFYDPGAGFVTGGGWFNSPAGAYTADPSLSGKATFGFVSRYQPGATIPSGNTEFQFKAGNLNFKSTSYDWLVVAGSKAQFKGSGTVNGSGNYEFMITATDGDAGSGSSDRIRVRIVQKSGGIVYDNQTSASDDSDPVTALGGGSIVIHR